MATRDEEKFIKFLDHAEEIAAYLKENHPYNEGSIKFANTLMDMTMAMGLVTQTAGPANFDEVHAKLRAVQERARRLAAKKTG